MRTMRAIYKTYVDVIHFRKTDRASFGTMSFLDDPNTTGSFPAVGDQALERSLSFFVSFCLDLMRRC